MNRRGFFKRIGAFAALCAMSPALISAASTPKIVKYKKLKVTWSEELAQDLKAFHGIDAEKEISNMLTHELNEEIKREIDGEVLEIIEKREISPTSFVPTKTFTVKYI